MDVTPLSAGVALLAVTGYLVHVLRRRGGDPDRVDGTGRALLRDVALTLVSGGALAAFAAAAEPVVARLPVDPAAVPWFVLSAAAVVAALRVLGLPGRGPRHLRAADPAHARYAHLARDALLPLCCAAAALLLLLTLRPLTGLPVEVEGLVVAVVSLLAHLLRLSSQVSWQRAPSRVTLRDVVAAGSGLALGTVGVLAALDGGRPLWAAGLTWLVTGAWGLGTAVLVRGPQAGPWPGASQDRGWWAVRLGAASALAGYLLAVLELDTTLLERFRVTLGLVLVGSGTGALLGRVAPDTQPMRSVRCLLPGLLVAWGPSTMHAVLAPDGVRPLVVALVALVGTALVVAGALLRWQAPLLVGFAVVVPGAVVQALPVVTSLPQWVYLAAAGAVALLLGVTWRQRQRALAAGRRWRELR